MSITLDDINKVGDDGHPLICQDGNLISPFCDLDTLSPLNSPSCPTSYSMGDTDTPTSDAIPGVNNFDSNLDVNSPTAKESPRYTQEALIFVQEIGRGSSSRVYKCIHVPTLSLVAVRIHIAL